MRPQNVIHVEGDRVLDKGHEGRSRSEHSPEDRTAALRGSWDSVKAGEGAGVTASQPYEGHQTRTGFGSVGSAWCGPQRAPAGRTLGVSCGMPS